MSFLNITVAFLMIFTIITYTTLEKHFYSEYSNRKHEKYLDGIHALQNKRAKDAYRRAYKKHAKHKTPKVIEFDISEEHFIGIIEKLLERYYSAILKKEPSIKGAIIKSLQEASSRQYKIKSLRTDTESISKLKFNDKHTQEQFYFMLLGKGSRNKKELYPSIGRLLYLGDNGILFIRYNKMTHDIILSTYPEMEPQLLQKEEIPKDEELPESVE